MTALVAAAVAGLLAFIAAAWARPLARHLPSGVAPGSGDHRVPGPIALVEMVERTSRDVRSGMALRHALFDATRARDELLPGLHHQLSRGTPVRAALAQLGPAATRDAAFVVHGLQLADDTGGAMADTLDRVVAVVRERQAWRAERQAQAAQARLSARMLTVLPMIVAIWGLASGPRVRQAYVQTPATVVLAGIGVGLNLLGWWWMSRLVRGPAGA